MNNIAIFASGSGTNAENIINFFRPSTSIKVKLILCNKPDALVIQRAQKHGIDAFVFTREEFYHSEIVLNKLREYGITHIVLAGFLWLVPKNILAAFPGKILNIHPALLPKYGGKGMYGEKVHNAVVENGEKESGITIHFVNENYDEGNIILQAKCPVDKNDTPESVARKVHALEYEHFPRVIGEVLRKG